MSTTEALTTTEERPRPTPEDTRRDVKDNVEWIETAERRDIMDRVLAGARGAFEQHAGLAVSSPDRPGERELRLYGGSRGDKLIVRETTETAYGSDNSWHRYILRDSTTPRSQWVEVSEGHDGNPLMVARREFTLSERLDPAITLVNALNMEPPRAESAEEVAHAMSLLEHGSPVRPEFSLKAHGKAMMALAGRALAPLRRLLPSQSSRLGTEQPQPAKAERQKPRETALRRNLRFIRGALGAARTDIRNGRRDGFERNK